MIRAALAALRAAAALPAAAQPFVVPVECTLGQTCFIQQFMDRDPGPGASDFACGPLSYDGHDGTDFAVPTRAAMDRGVAVLAPAAGTVRAVRDGMPDIAVGDPAAPALEGRDCGNGVVIDHEGGWQTQLCHLAQGSVAVRGGQAVAAGEPVGRIGLSGRTEFPHLHLTVRRDGVAVDPFHPDPAATCDAAPAVTLWADPPPYRPGGLIGLGVAVAPPTFAAVKAGLPETPALPRDAPALIVWAHLFGVRAGDRLMLRLAGPDGAVVNHDATLERTQARAMRFAGRRMPAAGWPPGTYAADAELTRDGAVIERMAARVTIAP